MTAIEVAVPVILIISCAASHLCGYLQGRIDGAEAERKGFEKCLDEIEQRRGAHGGAR